MIAVCTNNSESWIDVTKQDIENLEKPDKMLMKTILGTHGNPCTVFMYLELGFLPVKYVIMKKRLTFNTVRLACRKRSCTRALLVPILFVLNPIV